MGVVYYSRYLEFFEQARTESMEYIGLRWADVEEKGYYLPVVESHCEYLNGAHFEDEIIISVIMKNPPKVKVKFDYEVKLKTKGILLVRGYTCHGFTNHEGKPTQPPKLFVDRFKAAFDS